ncbi:Carbonic anhydrase [Pseudonocardia sp. Ae168_Ps1]|nr:Carbonic anhydrase [Pseudonocardia sp. Ae168_Ps1]OLL91630.1 Carbonic anhydrase [Pseudonocardia sp. Ae356_Ps1]
MDGIGRRQVLRGAVGTGLALVGAGVSATAAAAAPGGAARAAAPGIPEAVPDADGALRRLAEGNRRWRDLHPEHPHEGAEVRTRLVGGQHPFATVLCCVDSRVPPELVFDQGLGDLLTVRTAGQVLDDAVRGSLEFGRAELGIPLVVVLGHTSCGAVAAAVDAAAAGEEPSGRLGFLVDAIAPALPASGTREERIAAGVDENVRRIVAVLRADPDLSGPGSGGVPTVVGARYDLGTGRVDRIV